MFLFTMLTVSTRAKAALRSCAAKGEALRVAFRSIVGVNYYTSGEDEREVKIGRGGENKSENFKKGDLSKV